MAFSASAFVLKTLRNVARPSHGPDMDEVTIERHAAIAHSRRFVKQQDHMVACVDRPKPAIEVAAQPKLGPSAHYFDVLR